MRVFPKLTTQPFLPPCPDIPLYWGGCLTLAEPRASPPIGVQQGHPQLHMQLEPLVCPCVLFGWWFSPWDLCLVGIVVLMGLQTSPAPSILSLIPLMGPLCQFNGWLKHLPLYLSCSGRASQDTAISVSVQHATFGISNVVWVCQNLIVASDDHLQPCSSTFLMP